MRTVVELSAHINWLFEDDVPVGRSYREAPEIDGLIALDSGVPGDRLAAEITASYGTDLEARVLG